ncbi:MAG: Beta-galactosidase/beta-glucuronidase [Pedosphaera sp.]|nr:Beta-galactosidase/beta-glucuronidase [Pedosphaera sp.]
MDTTSLIKPLRKRMSSLQSRIPAFQSFMFFSGNLAGSAGFIVLFLGLLMPPCTAWSEDVASGSWKPSQGSLLTRWAAEVGPTNSHPEYPRPQLVRTEWLDLNGLWDFSITPSVQKDAPRYEGHILVPFPIESALSGVKRRLDENSSLWYRRQFTVPKEWSGKRVRLHFGAVDWRARVIINGQEAGQHRGGYDAFSFDITDKLKWKGDEELVVAVDDATEGDQARGKQSRKPEGIFYTPSSGIWQTVWLEPLPKVCIDDLSLLPDVDGQQLRLKVAVGSLSESLRIEVQALVSNKEVAQATGPANKEFSMQITTPHLWSPDDPFLYDLRITLKDGDNMVDGASSYFGMRKIALRRDESGVTRMALNNQFIFQTGALDQGFWPDGLYTAPTDEALRFDIDFLKRAGFNLIRKHVKVEPDRWYYWCDRLGLLVWQDMPSGNNTTKEGRTQFEAELQRLVEGRRNHPSIIMWVLFNEGWGQYDTERLVPWLKALDPSRLVDSASGWTDKRVGDIIDKHSYPGPESPQSDADRAAVIGEFGGFGLGLPGHTWSDKSWGYQQVPDETVLASRFCKLLERVHLLRDSFGLSAAVYTQTTDVETECNGLLTYDRAVAKIDPAIAQAASHNESMAKRFHFIVPDALQARVMWKCTIEKPADDWVKPEFVDSNWKEGIGGFGTKDTPGAMVNTVWNTPDIWLRREFTLNNGDWHNALLQVHHDEDVEIYINGVLAAQEAGYITTYDEVKINPEALAALRPGVNIMAVHCHQTGGGQFVDVGIVTPQSEKETEPKK